MKCNIVKDILPLYIDGLTSEESNREIEKHLNNCEECKLYYEEMVGNIPEEPLLSEADDVKLLKKYKKKKKRNYFIVALIILVFLSSSVYLYFSLRITPVNYSDVELETEFKDYEVDVSLKLKNTGILLINSIEEDFKLKNISGEYMYIKVVGRQRGLKPRINKDSNKISWGLKNKSQKMVFDFSDKIVIVEEGKIIEIRDK